MAKMTIAAVEQEVDITPKTSLYLGMLTQVSASRKGFSDVQAEMCGRAAAIAAPWLEINAVTTFTFVYTGVLAVAFQFTQEEIERALEILEWMRTYQTLAKSMPEDWMLDNMRDVLGDAKHIMLDFAERT